MNQNLKTILLAEDERVVALSLSMGLKALGYKVVKSVSRGKDLIEEAVKYAPDIIVTDIHLKDNISGIEAIEKIRSSFNPTTIFITGYSDPETKKEMENAKPDAYLIKPCTAFQISKAIEDTSNRDGTPPIKMHF